MGKGLPQFRMFEEFAFVEVEKHRVSDFGMRGAVSASRSRAPSGVGQIFGKSGEFCACRRSKTERDVATECSAELGECLSSGENGDGAFSCFENFWVFLWKTRRCNEDGCFRDAIGAGFVCNLNAPDFEHVCNFAAAQITARNGHAQIEQ